MIGVGFRSHEIPARWIRRMQQLQRCSAAVDLYFNKGFDILKRFPDLLPRFTAEVSVFLDHFTRTAQGYANRWLTAPLIFAALGDSRQTALAVAHALVAKKSPDLGLQNSNPEPVVELFMKEEFLVCFVVNFSSFFLRGGVCCFVSSIYSYHC